MIHISTSILNVKPENAMQTFYNLETAKTDYFHIDVMDGKFVKQENMKQMKEYAMAIKHISNLPLDVHLMVQNPKDVIDDYLELNPYRISVHIEALTKNVEETIKYIKEQGVKVGIAVSPKTPIEIIKKYLPYIHLVLIMTVEPGLGGQKLIPETINKIKELNDYRLKNNIEIDIEADGGINKDTIKQIKEAGTDIAVVGSSIINAEDYKKAIDSLKQNS